VFQFVAIAAADEADYPAVHENFAVEGFGASAVVGIDG
jgi:hypothetical protein